MRRSKLAWDLGKVAEDVLEIGEDGSCMWHRVPAPLDDLHEFARDALAGRNRRAFVAYCNRVDHLVVVLIRPWELACI
jgi:hypothetical protein